MKLTFLLMLAACLHVSAAGYAQKISLTLKAAPITVALQQIELQAGVSFVYGKTLLVKAASVNIDVRDQGLSDVLATLFEGQPFDFEISGKFVVLSARKDPRNGVPGTVSKNNIVVKGTVRNERGEPVMVTITVKGTTNATSSDAAGNFTLRDVPDNAVLLVTGVNIEPLQLKAGVKTEMLIQVKTRVTTGDAVTVTAYGIERKAKEIGYSVTKVTGAEINKANSGNLLTGLIGKVSGLSITTQSSDMTPQMRVLLRGIRSFGENSNNQPLFIFNGSPLSFGNDQIAASQAAEFLNNFNPADIEDVTILKGANGTALYGPEGVNGVIIITTKKANQGAPVVNFRNNTAVQIVDFRRDNRQRQFGIGTGQVDQYGNGIFDPRATTTWGPAYDGNQVPIGYPDENGQMQMVSYSDKKDSRRFFDPAVVNRTNLSFSHSDQTSSYYLGLGYVKQTGLLPGDKQDQVSVLLSTKKKIGSKLTVGTNINFARTSSNRGKDLGDAIRNMPTFIPLLDYKDYKNGYWANRNRYWNYISPYEDLANDRTRDNTTAVTGSLVLELKPVDWLTIRDQPGINYSGYYSKQKVGELNFAEFARQDFSKFSDRFALTSERMISNTSLNNDLLVSTIHKKGDLLFRTNLGSTIRQNYVKQLQSGASVGVPVYNIDFSIGPPVSAEAELLSRTISAFGSTSVGYKDKIFIEITGRNEWDSKRAKVARGKDFYASANSSFILPEIFPALKRLKWMSNARLRASLAKSANMNISPYQSERILLLSSGYPLVNPDNGSYVLSYAFVPDVNPNPLLDPERVMSQEYGLSLTLFRNLLDLDFTYYYQVNNSVILGVANAWLSGYPTTDNAGRFQNHGLEFDINLNPVPLGGNFTLSAQLRGAINRNKVLSLTPVYNGLFVAKDNSGQQYFARPGKSAFEFGVTDWLRDPEGRVIVDRVSGFPTPTEYGTYSIAGTTLPKYTASVAINLTWKRFTLSAMMDYIGGYDHLFGTDLGFYQGTDPRTTYNNRKPYVFPNSSYDDGTGKYVANTSVVVKNANQELYSGFSSASKYGLINASNWKFREFALQYELPMKTNWIKGMNLSVYGRDLFAFYPKSNIYGDPGLIRGPGSRDMLVSGGPVIGGGNPNNNLTGGSSDASTLPGTVQVGFTLSARF